MTSSGSCAPLARLPRPARGLSAPPSPTKAANLDFSSLDPTKYHYAGSRSHPWPLVEAEHVWEIVLEARLTWHLSRGHDEANPR